MKMNRRNALLGIGAIATGGGALFGSGAFSQVNADRNVTIDLNADKTAGTNVELVANSSSSIANNSSGNNTNQLGVAASNLNVDATTEFDAVFDITQNSGGSRLFSVSNVSFNKGTVTLFADSSLNSNDIGGDIGDLNSKYVTLSDGAKLTVGLKVEASDTTTGSETNQITVEVVDEESDFTHSPGDSGYTETN